MIVVVCEDLFFWAKIHAVASAKGVRAVRAADDAAMDSALAAGDVDTIFADLAVRAIDLQAWAARWKSLPRPPRIVGFVSHVDVEAQRRARDAGFDEVLARSRFTERLPDLI